MEQANGIWDFLFGVNDPNASNVKMEDDANISIDLPEDFIALLNGSDMSLEPYTSPQISTLKDAPVIAALEMTDDTDKFESGLLDLVSMADLAPFLQVSETISSSLSGTSSDDNCSESSQQSSPKSVHSASSDQIEVDSKQELVLSPEEQSLLSKEGINLPKFLPLTKQEERALKRIRRKIRNKRSAQESRRKKKVYLDQLLDQVKDMSGQNKTLQKKVKDLEKENSSLTQQLKTLQSLIGRSTRSGKTTSTCLMALVLSVALILTPYNKNTIDNIDDQSLVSQIQEMDNRVNPVRTRVFVNSDYGPPEIAIPIFKDIRLDAASGPRGKEAHHWDAKVSSEHAWDGRLPLENLTVELRNLRADH